MYKIIELSKMIDHSLLHPTMTDNELAAGCALAKAYNTASVCIKPYAVQQAKEWLKGSDVLVCSVVGFPHGNSSTVVKVFEAEQGCLEGAREIDMVVNIGKVLSNDWDYIEEELRAIIEVTKKYGATLKVIFENDFLPDDSYKIKLCEICNIVGVEFIKTSTGYGFVKNAEGTYSYKGATDHDLVLMRKYADTGIQIKAAGGVRTLDDLLRVKALGVTRIGATTTANILEEAKKRFGSPGDVPSITDNSIEGY
jgi:deoxyribose-phosphate aldolase